MREAVEKIRPARRHRPADGAGARWLRILAGLLLAGLIAAAPLSAAEPLQVVIDGVEEEETLANLEAALAPPPGLLHDDKLDRQWLERFARQVPRLAAEALKPFGYYHAEIEARLEDLDDKRFRLVVAVQPGEPVRVTALAVTATGPGAANQSLRELLENFPLQRGGRLRQDHYEQGKAELRNKAIDLGYLDAAFAVQQIRIDLAQHSAEVELALATGERYHFAGTQIDGAPDYPQPFLRRYLAYAPGDPFSHARLGQTQLNYLNSERFREVTVIPRPELAEERQIPVDIQLSPAPRRRLRPGIGYGTDTGARVSLVYRDVNLLQRGHEFSAEIKAAEHQQSLTAGYIIPSHRHLSDHVALRTGYDHEDLDTYESSKLFIEGELVRAFTHGRLGSVYLRLLQEDFIIGDTDSRSRLVLPGIQFSQRRYDDPLQPRKGYLYRLELRGTHQALGSDTGLLQALLSANALRPLPWGFALLTRVQVGTTWQNEALREIPPSLRFFAGGDQSVRGYAYQTLGPRDSNDEVVGGKHLLVGSIELERPLTAAWGVAAFFDAGNAFDTFSDYEIFEGVGMGVRRYTPIGPLKFDLARQLGVSDPSYRLHVSIGFAW
jgi:translocation and assembly module TamA